MKLSTQKLNLNTYFIRKSLMVFIGLGVAIFLFWYVNTYIYKFFASTDPVSVTMTPTKETIDLSGKSDEEFNIAFQVANQDVSGMELYLTYDSKYLQYGKEYSDTGFIQPENFKYDVLLEEIEDGEEGKKKVKLLIVATSEIPVSPNNARLLNFKFKAIAVDPADTEKIDNVIQTITLDTATQFVGASAEGEAAAFANPTDPVIASVTIFRGSGDTTITPGDPSGSPSPSGATLGFSPGSSNIQIDDVFTVDVTIDSGSEQVVGTDAYVMFDADKLELQSITSEDHFPILSNVPATGQVYLAATVANQADSKTGTGKVAKIVFKATKEGATSISIKCNAADNDSSKIIKNDSNATNILDCSSLTAHQVTISPASDVPSIITPSVSTPSPIVTSSSGDSDVELKMKVRFQGITKQPASAYDSLNVQVNLEGSSGFKNDQIVQFKADGSGLWNGTMKVSNVPISQKFAVLIKGPKHLSRKICVSSPRENVPGTYKCSDEDMTLKSGANELDFSNIVVLAGDIPTQNQVVDSADIIYIRQNFGNKSPTALSRGDLNLDGIIDTQDYSLVMAALGFKYDETL